jgi:hypothetical protein
VCPCSSSRVTSATAESPESNRPFTVGSEVSPGDQPPATTTPRDVVEKQDAVDAVLHLVAALDEQVQEGIVPVERGTWMMSLLMVIRDYIEPCPQASLTTE